MKSFLIDLFFNLNIIKKQFSKNLCVTQKIKFQRNQKEKIIEMYQERKEK